MADATFRVEYAVTGRATCKDTKCKKNIANKVLRIGRELDNPFGDDTMTNWSVFLVCDELRQVERYHAECIFSALQRARKDSKRIESDSDLQGFDKLEAADQAMLRRLIIENGGSVSVPAPKPVVKLAPPIVAPAPIIAPTPAVSIDDYCAACWSGNCFTAFGYPVYINGKSSRGQTPLYCAARQGHLMIVQHLLSKGANVNALEDNARSTPLHAAAYEGHEAVVAELLAAGAGWCPAPPLSDTSADRSIRSARGLTALDEAKTAGVATLLRAPPAPAPAVAAAAAGDDDDQEAVWQWAGDAGGMQNTWIDYNAGVCAALEVALIKKKTKVKIDDERYVDLSDPSQPRQRRYDDPERYRKVRRQESASATGKRKAPETSGAMGASKGFICINCAKDWEEAEDALLEWEMVLSNEEDDFEEGLIKKMDGDAWEDDCDIPVPPAHLNPVVAKVKATKTLDWERWEGPETADDRWFWATTDGKGRLMYARHSKFAPGDSHFVALEHVGMSLAVVCGHCGCHPFAASTRFRYSNSDGSASEGPAPADPQPRSVIDYLVDRLQHHAGANADH